MSWAGAHFLTGLCIESLGLGELGSLAIAARVCRDWREHVASRRATLGIEYPYTLPSDLEHTRLVQQEMDRRLTQCGIDSAGHWRVRGHSCYMAMLRDPDALSSWQNAASAVLSLSAPGLSTTIVVKWISQKGMWYTTQIKNGPAAVLYRLGTIHKPPASRFESLKLGVNPRAGCADCPECRCHLEDGYLDHRFDWSVRSSLDSVPQPPWSEDHNTRLEYLEVHVSVGVACTCDSGLWCS